MTDDSGMNVVDMASAGVQDLASTATGVLDQAGPAGALLQPVVDSLRNVWEGYFGSPIPSDGTNWNSYTHEQLFQMLWDKADVAEVSGVAAELGRHSTELAEHADSMHRERGAMQTNWQGDAANMATHQLGELGERTSGIGSRAGTVQGAVQGAGDALAQARNAMPPPPGDPTGPATAGTTAGAGAGALIGGLIGAGAGGVGAAPGAMIGSAVGAVAGGGASLFVSSVNAAHQKAEAVHVMQRYETSLGDSSNAVAAVGPGANGNGRMPAQTSSVGFGGAPAGGGYGSGGVPWNQLVGDDQLAAGGRSGVRPGSSPLGNAMMAQPGAASRLGAARAGGMIPPGARAGRGAAGEEAERRSRLPVVDQHLFDVLRPGSVPVIGE